MSLQSKLVQKVFMILRDHFSFAPVKTSTTEEYEQGNIPLLGNEPVRLIIGVSGVSLRGILPFCEKLIMIYDCK